MVSAVWAFLSSPWGRRIALIGGLLLGLWLAWAWHGRHAEAVIDRARVAAIDARDAMWRGKLQAAEAAARDAIQRKEDAAYRRGIEDQAKRDAADAEDAAKAETIIREIVHESPSAASCRYDDAAVAGLNRLRRGQD